MINEFLLFLKMDYTQSVYVKEANLKTNLTRDKLIKKIGSHHFSKNKYRFINRIKRKYRYK